MEPADKIRELQNAIAALESQRSILGNQVVDASIASIQKEIDGLRPAYTEERKLVSILFCDIVGSSRMAADRDPEDVLNIVNGALQEMSLAVEAFGGTVTRYMGDGVLAVFGAPKAQERHAEQAIRAGLAIQERIEAYGELLRKQRGLSGFKVRVGINSGRVVGGGVGGEHGEYTVIGDAVNMAARFEDAAPPGGVLIGETTYQLSGGERVFETQTLSPIEVKGSPRPQPVYLVLHALALPRLQVASQAPLTGRNAELSELQAGYRRVASNSKLEIIRVIGPAGIGKSRLRQEFVTWLESLAAPPRTGLGFALAYTVNTPYALASSLLNASLGIVEADTMEQRRGKLKRGWKTAGELSIEHLHGLAALASIEFEDSQLKDLEPQARREVIFESFIAYWQGHAQEDNLVLILEDTHWADTLSLDLIEELVAALPHAPLLLVSFTRPDRRQDEGQERLQSKLGEDAFSQIFLNELDPGQTGQLVQGLLASEDVPPDLIQAIDGQAQGNPFFIEEIINSLLEDGSLIHRQDGWELTRDLAEIQVPDTVQGVLAARIDRLETDDKQTLQHAAIIGRTFSQQVLADLLVREIEETLGKLSERDFILRLGGAALMDDWEWLFRHVLVQEVAYESVLVEVRRQIHCRIANYLEANAQDRLDELASILALHFERGGIWERALHYLARAAELSAGVFALREALTFYDQAVEMAIAHPEEIGHETLLELYEKRGDVRALAYEFEGAEADFTVVLAAAQSAVDRAHEQSLLVKLGFLYRTADRLDEAVEFLEEGLAVARHHADRRAVADTLYHLGTVAWTEGDNNAALAYQQEAVDICRQLGLEDLVAVQALHGLAEAQMWAGKPQLAVENFQESIELARQIGDKSYESENLYMLAGACYGDGGIGDFELGRRSADMALDISRKARMDGHTAPGMLNAGNVYGPSGDYQQGFDYLYETRDWSKKLGVIRFQTALYYHLGHLYREINLYEKAQAADALGLQIATDHGVGFYLLALRAGLAIDRLRLGDLNVEDEILEAYKMTGQQGQGVHGIRCLEGLCQWALASGELQTGLAYSSKLQQLAEAGGMRENAARARKYRGEAFTEMGEFEAAENELKQVEKMADEIKGVRLQWDVHAALERLYRAWGKDTVADEHRARVMTIVNQIRENLKYEELKVGLPDFTGSGW
jgi:class 3 adenylate cyclase/tetratricopeptide (TPR) repeat protein